MTDRMTDYWPPSSQPGHAFRRCTANGAGANVPSAKVHPEAHVASFAPFSYLGGIVADLSNALQASEERHRSLADTVPVGLLRVTVTWKVVEANVAMARMLGYTDTAELLERRLPNHWADRTKWRETLALLECHDAIDNHAARVVCVDDSLIWVSLSVRTVRDVDGKVLCYDALVQDITERKRIDAELTQYRDHLEELVALRTSEVAVASEQAKVAAHARNAFLANISHELRTPLTAILGYAQLLSGSQGLTPRQLAGLNVITSSAHHLARLIDDLLDVSRVESGKLKLYPGEIDVSAFLRGVADIVRLKADQKHLELVCDFAPDLPRAVRADSVRLRQVLLNLLGNAIKFTDRGQIILRARSVSLGVSQARLCLEVQDTGHGIAPQYTEAIFEPFVQIGSDDHCDGGLGLGLAISREIVQLMGGSLRVESTLGVGTLFSLDVVVSPSHVV